MSSPVWAVPSGKEIPATQKPKIIGHRGARAAFPENTIASVQHALAAGADLIEIDVGISRDEVVVVHHDSAIMRHLCLNANGLPVFHKLPLISLTYEEIRKFDCGTLPNLLFPRQKRVRGATIPTLEEVLIEISRYNQLHGTNVAALVEIKTQPESTGLTPTPAHFAALTLKVIEKAKMQKNSYIQSFDYSVLREVNSQAPWIPVGALTENANEDMVATAQALAAAFVAPEQSLVTKESIDRLHERGILVFPWTVNSRKNWERLIQAGVDGIITDAPLALFEHLNQRGQAAGVTLQP